MAAHLRGLARAVSAAETAATALDGAKERQDGRSRRCAHLRARCRLFGTGSSPTPAVNRTPGCRRPLARARLGCFLVVLPWVPSRYPNKGHICEIRPPAHQPSMLIGSSRQFLVAWFILWSSLTARSFANGKLADLSIWRSAVGLVRLSPCRRIQIGGQPSRQVAFGDEVLPTGFPFTRICLGPLLSTPHKKHVAMSEGGERPARNGGADRSTYPRMTRNTPTSDGSHLIRKQA